MSLQFGDANSPPGVLYSRRAVRGGLALALRATRDSSRTQSRYYLSQAGIFSIVIEVRYYLSASLLLSWRQKKEVVIERRNAHPRSAPLRRIMIE
ncbi:MAG: hypothetical protein PHH85_01890 [Candidatus Methanoperedens sp.]|nr:hypothetical protein [Candidatus Methanoperedens sp.]